MVGRPEAIHMSEKATCGSACEPLDPRQHEGTDIRRYRSLFDELRPHGESGALLQQFAGVLRKNVIHLCQIAFGEPPPRRTRVRLSLFGRLRAGDNGGHRGA